MSILGVPREGEKGDIKTRKGDGDSRGYQRSFGSREGGLKPTSGSSVILVEREG